MTAEFAPWLGVFETVRVIEGVPLFVREHEAELERAVAALGHPLHFNRDAIKADFLGCSGRWRWTVTPEGTKTFFTEEGPLATQPLELSLSAVRVGSQNWDARFKTVSYLSHVQALQMATTSEAVLLNEHRQVASAARANIFWRRGERLYTPAHEAGCRRGVVREFVLERRTVEEGAFPFEDLLEADEVFLTNSMRGIISVRLLEGRPLMTFPAADELRTEYQQAVQEQLAGA